MPIANVQPFASAFKYQFFQVLGGNSDEGLVAMAWPAIPKEASENAELQWTVERCPEETHAPQHILTRSLHLRW